jgi:hypothetical protein
MISFVKSLVITVLLLSSNALTLSQSKQFDNGYSSHVVSHIKKISEFGKRQIGSSGSEKTASYIRDQFEKIGLVTKEEPFESDIYAVDEIDLSVAGNKYKVDLVGFDPYKGKTDYSGQLVLFDSESRMNPEKIAGHVIAAKMSADYFQLMMMNAAAVVFVEGDDFVKMSHGADRSFSLNVLGHMERVKSSNVVGYLSPGNNEDEEIIITAHYDAYQNSPGANDNGTGIGSLIELAGILAAQRNNLHAGIRFVAFGGEEVGLLGSRMYLNSHIEDLKKCKLLFNIDTIGGGTIAIETEGGMKNSSKNIKNKFPGYLMDKALEGLNGNWRILNPDVIPVLMTSNNPAWIKEYAHQASKEENIELIYGSAFFSDQMIFAQAGVPVSGMAQKTGSKILHSSQDTIEKLDLEAIKKSGIICYSIIMAAMGTKSD